MTVMELHDIWSYVRCGDDLYEQKFALDHNGVGNAGVPGA
jgi:hypothetical protein